MELSDAEQRTLDNKRMGEELAKMIGEDPKFAESAAA
jgi:hypothetical protein